MIIFIASLSAINAAEIQDNDNVVVKDQSVSTTDEPVVAQDEPVVSRDEPVAQNDSEVSEDEPVVAQDDSAVTKEEIETSTKTINKNTQSKTKEADINYTQIFNSLTSNETLKNLDTLISETLKNINVTTNKINEKINNYDFQVTNSNSSDILSGVISQKNGSLVINASIIGNNVNLTKNSGVSGLITLNNTNFEMFSNVGFNKSVVLNITLPENKYPDWLRESIVVNGRDNITITYTGFDNVTKNITLNLTNNKDNVTVKVNPINGIIGEKVTLTALVKDAKGNLVNEGNLVFKVNGRTLKTNGRFDGIALPQKFNVRKGIATVTITADTYLRNAKNLTASYSGSSKYNAAKSNVVTAQIKKRNAKLTVTTTPKLQKQYEQIIFTAKLTDTTKGHKNNTAMNTNTKVFFKINGKTIKDILGRKVLVNVVNNTATYKYTVPAGMGGITKDKKIRNYIVEAVLVSDTFYPDTRDTTYFNVKRSPITINLVGVNVNKDNQISLLANIKDYKNKNVVGTNKVAIKINGKTYVNPTTKKTQYLTIRNGIVLVYKLQVPTDIKIKKLMLVTGARQAYLGQRNETSQFVNIWPL